MIMEILDELKAVVRPFIYNMYNIVFDPNVVLNKTHVVLCVANVEHLLTNDKFLYSRL
jgi:hypothetical protein